VTDSLLVLKKLAIVREHILRVRRRRPEAVEAFVADIDMQDATAMSFVVAVQEAADIAFHVVADEGWGLAGSYRDAFDALARHGVVTAAHANELADCAKVRNRVVHGYTTVDAERFWVELPAGIDALERYIHAIARHVGDPT
jgi:uncharacterized protein YutE (UPF0331/DUF86 family)